MKTSISTLLMLSTVLFSGEINSLPNWVLEPNIDGYICDIGSANFQNNINQTKKASFITAKANVSKQISIWVSTESKSRQDSTGKSDFSAISQQISANMIENVFIKDEFYDNRHNRYHTRVCTQITTN